MQRRRTKNGLAEAGAGSALPPNRGMVGLGGCGGGPGLRRREKWGGAREQLGLFWEDNDRWGGRRRGGWRWLRGGCGRRGREGGGRMWASLGDMARRAGVQGSPPQLALCWGGRSKGAPSPCLSERRLAPRQVGFRARRKVEGRRTTYWVGLALWSCQQTLRRERGGGGAARTSASCSPHHRTPQFLKI